MTETGEPAIIDEATLRDIDLDIRRAETVAEFRRDKAKAAMADAGQAEEHARLLPAVRRFLTARMGMPLEQALAEAEAELKIAEAGMIEADKEVERAKERVRDLEGWRRIQAELAERDTLNPEG